MSEPVDAPLEVEIMDGRLVISIGVNTLAFAAAQQEIDGGQPIGIEDPVAAAESIRRALRREEEDGTTLVHTLLDKAALDAWEDGDDGFVYDDDATPPDVGRAP